MMTVVSAGMSSLLGRRSSNQDRCFAMPPWAMVLDGVGGTVAGGQAAQIALGSLVGSTAELTGGPGVTHDTLKTIAGRAHEEVTGRLGNSGATTMTLAYILPLTPTLSSILFCWVGDSPAWIVSQEARRPVQVLPAVSDNEIDGALGWNPLELEVSTASILGSGRLILATDGILAAAAQDRDAIMANRSISAQQCATQLAEAAIKAQGGDNTSVVVIDLGGVPLESSTAPLTYEED